MPRLSKHVMTKLQAIREEMEKSISSETWSKEVFESLRKRAHDLVPGCSDAHSFLLSNAKQEWLSEAYRVRNPIKNFIEVDDNQVTLSFLCPECGNQEDLTPEGLIKSGVPVCEDDDHFYDSVTMDYIGATIEIKKD